MTEADEQREIQYEVDRFNNKLRKLNEKHKHIQVTGFKLQINHPALVQAEPQWKKFVKGLFKWNTSADTSGKK